MPECFTVHAGLWSHTCLVTAPDIICSIHSPIPWLRCAALPCHTALIPLCFAVCSLLCTVVTTNCAMPDFLSHSRQAALLETLSAQLPWKRQVDDFGEQQRDSCYVGDQGCVFSYVGLRLVRREPSQSVRSA